VVVAGLVVVVWWYAAKSQDPARSDATADWVLVKGVAAGWSQLTDIRVLADLVGVPFVSLTEATEYVLHYRPPSALVLLHPLTTFEWNEAHTVVNVVGVLCFLWMLLVQIPRYCDRSIESMWFPLALAPVSAAFVETAYWGALSAIIATLVTASIFRSDSAVGRISLGVATAMKLYPGLLFIPLLVRRRISGLVALGTLLSLMVAGVALFELPLGESFRFFLEGPRIWLTRFANVSLAAVLFGPGAPPWSFLVVGLLGVVAVSVYSIRRPLSQSLALAASVSVLVSPLSWASYDMLLIPLVFWIWTRKEFPLGKYVSGGWLVFQALAWLPAELEAVGLVRVAEVIGRVAVTLAVGLAPSQLWTQGEANEARFTGYAGQEQIPSLPALAIVRRPRP